MASCNFFLTLVGGLILMSALANGGKCPNEETYTCKHWGTIISCKYTCDGYTSCPLGDDEWGCPCNENYPQFRCDDGTCIPAPYTCESWIDCPDGEDEAKEYCSSYICKGGGYIDASEKCDGKMDCRSGSDEVNCDCDENHTYQCPGEDKWCMPISKKCDHYMDCDDGSDESMCPCNQESHTFQCILNNTNSCIPQYYVCDGYPDCENFRDETMPYCPPPAGKNERSGKRSVGKKIPNDRITNEMN